MKANIGKWDRVIRVLLAITFATLFFKETVTGTLGIVLMTLAVVLVLTSTVSFCPIYAPFGFSTRSTKK